MYGWRGRIGLLGLHDVQPGFGSLFEHTFAAPDPAAASAPIKAVG